ncbi:MAG TPA: hypothetical protein VFB38_24820 [Chthonomonadaceae bacterium]|nr:hypothetical protein [Chthonomonadaceae bacterium]
MSNLNADEPKRETPKKAGASPVKIYDRPERKGFSPALLLVLAVCIVLVLFIWWGLTHWHVR